MLFEREIKKIDEEILANRTRNNEEMEIMRKAAETNQTMLEAKHITAQLEMQAVRRRVEDLATRVP